MSRILYKHHITVSNNHSVAFVKQTLHVTALNYYSTCNLFIADLSQVWCLKKIKIITLKNHLLHSFQFHRACDWFHQLMFAKKTNN